MFRLKSIMAVIMFLSALLVSKAGGQTPTCLQTEFSGEATRLMAFSQEIGGGVTFSVEPMSLREDPNETWFVIRAIRDDASPFVFNPSDTNWVLAASGFWTAFIGGAHTDLHAALGYRFRQLLIPLSAKDKEKARRAANMVYEASTPKQKRDAIAALKAAHLAQADFEITDYAVGPGEPAVGVDWVRFNVTMRLPSDFIPSGNLPVSVVDCPAIPAEAIANLADPHRHEYLLSRQKQLRQ